MADRVLVEALERLVVGAVGMTAVALAEFTPAAELTLPQWRALLVVARAERPKRLAPSVDGSWCASQAYRANARSSCSSSSARSTGRGAGMVSSRSAISRRR